MVKWQRILHLTLVHGISAPFGGHAGAFLRILSSPYGWSTLKCWWLCYFSGDSTTNQFDESIFCLHSNHLEKRGASNPQQKNRVFSMWQLWFPACCSSKAIQWTTRLKSIFRSHMPQVFQEISHWIGLVGKTSAGDQGFERFLHVFTIKNKGVPYIFPHT